MFCNFWVIFLKMKAFEADTFSSLSTQPVNSIFSVIVRIYKIHVIEKAFFSLQPLPWKVRKCLFPISLVNSETNCFNKIMQLIINPNCPWIIESNQKNRVKGTKSTQWKLLHWCIFYPIVKDPDPKNGIK